MEKDAQNGFINDNGKKTEFMEHFDDKGEGFGVGRRKRRAFRVGVAPFLLFAVLEYFKVP